MRSRNIKPGFFTNEDLAECSPFARLLFAGLWLMADREGRLEDRPKRIKAELLPYDSVDANDLLNELVEHQFIIRYEVNGTKVIQVVNFVKHQNPHPRESKSVLPGIDEATPRHVQGNEKDMTSPADILIPESLIPESLNPDILIPESDAMASKVDQGQPSLPEKPPVLKTSPPPKSRKVVTHHFDLPSLPDDWKVYCEQVRPELDPNRVFLHFSFYFKSGNGNGKVRSDKGWNQSWQNWVRRETNNLTLKPNPPYNNGVKQISTRPPLEDFSDRNYPKGVVYLGRNK